MKRLPLPLASLVVIFGAVVLLQQRQQAPVTGFVAPDFTLPDLAGRTYRLSDFRGKVVFLNLWATWCPPCRQEMPSMERLYQRFKHRDFVMLAVSEDEDGPTSVVPFVQSLGLTFPILLDDQSRLPARYGVTGFPETFIIDKSGNVVKHHIGPADWDTEEVMRDLTALLDEPPEPHGAIASEAR